MPAATTPSCASSTGIATRRAAEVPLEGAATCASRSPGEGDWEGAALQTQVEGDKIKGSTVFSCICFFFLIFFFH